MCDVFSFFLIEFIIWIKFSFLDIKRYQAIGTDFFLCVVFSSHWFLSVLEGMSAPQVILLYILISLNLLISCIAI
jgi:hypothetical protein